MALEWSTIVREGAWTLNYTPIPLQFHKIPHKSTQTLEQNQSLFPSLSRKLPT